MENTLHLTEALTIIIIIALIAKQLSWFIDNTDQQNIRDKAIDELKSPPEEALIKTYNELEDAPPSTNKHQNKKGY